jgi:hypothetical protein
MTDASPSPLQAQANQDFASLQSTVNSFENNKITEAQATTAFQQEVAQINEHGTKDLVLGKLTDLQDPSQKAAMLKDFPGLSLMGGSPESSGSYAFGTLGKPNPNKFNEVFIDQDKNGNLSIVPNNETDEPRQLAIEAKYYQPIEDSAMNYFEGKADAATTDKAITAEFKAANDAGLDLNHNPFMAGQGFSNFSLTDSGVDITSMYGEGPTKKIEVINGVANAQDMSGTLRKEAYEKPIAEYAVAGAAIGAFAGSLPGAAIGAGIGAVVGLAKGELDYVDEYMSLYYDNAAVLQVK